MSFIKHKVKFVEGFKDGNILEGRFFKPGEIVVLDEQDVAHIQTSGGVIEEIELVIPNPLKKPAEEGEPENADASPNKGKPRGK